MSIVVRGAPNEGSNNTGFSTPSEKYKVLLPGPAAQVVRGTVLFRTALSNRLNAAWLKMEEVAPTSKVETISTEADLPPTTTIPVAGFPAKLLHEAQL